MSLGNRHSRWRAWIPMGVEVTTSSPPNQELRRAKPGSESPPPSDLSGKPGAPESPDIPGMTADASLTSSLHRRGEAIMTIKGRIAIGIFFVFFPLDICSTLNNIGLSSRLNPFDYHTLHRTPRWRLKTIVKISNSNLRDTTTMPTILGKMSPWQSRLRSLNTS